MKHSDMNKNEGLFPQEVYPTVFWRVSPSSPKLSRNPVGTCFSLSDSTGDSTSPAEQKALPSLTNLLPILLLLLLVMPLTAQDRRDEPERERSMRIRHEMMKPDDTTKTQTATIKNSAYKAASPEQKRYGTEYGMSTYYDQEWRVRNHLHGMQYVKPPRRQVVIAIIDGGARYTDPSFKNHLWQNPGEVNGKPGVDDDGNGYVDDIYGIDPYNGDGDPFEDFGPGTEAASTIIGTANMPDDYAFDFVADKGNVKIMLLKCGNAWPWDGGTNFDTNVDSIVKCFRYARNKGADVIHIFSNNIRHDLIRQEVLKFKGPIFTAIKHSWESGAPDSKESDYLLTSGFSNTIGVLPHKDNYQKEYTKSWNKKADNQLAAISLCYSLENYQKYYPDKYKGLAGYYAHHFPLETASQKASGVASRVLSIYPTLTTEQIKNLLISTSDQRLALLNYSTSRGSINGIRAVLARSGGGQVFDADYARKKNTLIPPLMRHSNITYNNKLKALYQFGGDSHSGVGLGDPDHWYSFKNGRWKREDQWNAIKKSPGLGYLYYMVYDTVRDLFVVLKPFITKTYEFDGSTWTEKSFKSSERPLIRVPTIAYDSDRNILIAMGVDSSNWSNKVWQTWEYDGNTWNEIDTAKTPPLLSNFSAVYNPIKKETVIFGGRDGANSASLYTSECWSYNGNNWKRKTNGIHIAQNYGSIFFEDRKNRVLLFEGLPKIVYCHNVWQFKDDIWTLIHRNIPFHNYEKFIGYNPDEHQYVYFTDPVPNKEAGIVRGTNWIFSDFTPPHWIDHMTSGANDYDGDGKADLATWTPGETGTWNIRGKAPIEIGTWGDEPVPGDYNGDGRAEPAVYRRSTRQWIFADGTKIQYGDFDAIPMPADYDGDGKTDIAWYDEYNACFKIKGQKKRSIGRPGLIPVVGDFDGDGAADVGVWSPFDCSWTIETEEQPVIFGTPIDEKNLTGCSPVVGDFDGDGRDDLGLWNPRKRQFSMWDRAREKEIRIGHAGKSWDIPVVGDYNGDGTDEPAAWNPEYGRWSISYNKKITTYNFGTIGDIPLIR